MELSKLQKHSKKLIKNRQKLKYLSLGVIIPSSVMQSSEQLTNKLIDMDSCLHTTNSSQVLISQIADYIPDDSKHIQINKLYAYFIHKLNQKDDQKLQEGERFRKKSQQSLLNNQDQLKYNQKNCSMNKVTDQLAKIYEQADKKHQIKRFKIAKMQKQIQKLLFQSHQAYTQLMQIKKRVQSTLQLEQTNEKNVYLRVSKNQEQQNQQTPRIFRSKASSFMLSKDLQFQSQNKKINALKQSIDKKQQQMKRLLEIQRAFAEQKIMFLKLVLKKGFKLRDGIWWILVKLAKQKQSLTKNDFANIIDDITKQHIIQEYQSMKQQICRKTYVIFPKINQRVKNKKQQFINLQSRKELVNQKMMSNLTSESSKRIYEDTQNYIVNWIRRQQWKVRSLKHRPTIQIQISKNWRSNEIKRLKTTYPRKIYQDMLFYVFGSIKYFSKLSATKIEQFLTTKRLNDNSNSPESIRTSYQGKKSVEYLTRNNTNK